MREPPTPPPDDAAPRRPVWMRPAALAAAALVAAAVAEGAVRVAVGDRFAHGARALRPQDALGRYDADIGWALLPNVSTTLLAEGTSYRVTTNARGFRGADLPESRTADRPCIVVLGDSYAFGWGVDNGETFADLLPGLVASLRGTGSSAASPEVANLAVPGYSTDQELWTLEREGVRLRPDVVVLQFCFNDPEANETTFAHQYLKPRFVRDADGAWQVRGRPVNTFVPVGAAPPAWSESLAARSALWAVLSGTVPIRAPSATADNAAGLAAMRAAAERMGPDSVTAMLLGRVKSRCDEIGARLVVFDASATGRIENARGPRVEEPFLTPVSRRLAALGQGAGFHVVSVDGAMRDAARLGAVLTVPDGHWNAAGHRAVAESLAGDVARLLAK